jgi:HIV-1 Vpr-binding protein
VHKQFNFTSSGFTNLSSKYIIGTDKENYSTLIYDTETCQEVFVLKDPAQINSKCAPKFSCDDDLVLSSGMLWDYRMRRHIHRFDRLSDIGDEQFHPNGCEVFIASDIWDLRTFKLRTTCSLLANDLCFNKAGDVVFSLSHQPDFPEKVDQKNALKSFRVIDAVDYELIAEITLENQPIALHLHRSDDFLAIVEEEDIRQMNLEQTPPPIKIWEIGNASHNRKNDDNTETETDDSSHDMSDPDDDDQYFIEEDELDFSDLIAGSSEDESQDED